MFHHILVPLDESSLAEQALPLAARIARATGGSLRLLHVVNDPLDYAWQYGDAALASARIAEADYSRAETYLYQLASSEELRGISVATEVLSGDPAHSILKASLANAVDLVVMCTHGSSGLTHWLLGSVTSKVAHTSQIPLLILYPAAQQSGTTMLPEGQIRVLVPLDGSPLAETALEPALRMSQSLSAPQSASVHLASVLPINEVGWPLMDREETIQQAQTYLAHVKDSLRQKGEDGQHLAVTTSVTISPDVASSLVQLAESGTGAEKADGETTCAMIAIATHGRGAFARWVMGSIAERILHTSKLPILLLRPQHVAGYAGKQPSAAEQKQSSEDQQAEDVQAWSSLF